MLKRYEVLRDIILWRRGYETWLYAIVINFIIIAIGVQKYNAAIIASGFLISSFIGAPPPRYESKSSNLNHTKYSIPQALFILSREKISYLIIAFVTCSTTYTLSSFRMISLFSFIDIVFNFFLFITKKYSDFELQVNRYWLKELIDEEFDYFVWFNIMPEQLSSTPIMAQLPYVDKLDFYEVIKFQDRIVDNLSYFENITKIIEKSDITEQCRIAISRQWNDEENKLDYSEMLNKSLAPGISITELERQNREIFLLQELRGIIQDVFASEARAEMERLQNQIRMEEEAKRLSHIETEDKEESYIKIEEEESVEEAETPDDETPKKKKIEIDIESDPWFNEISDPRLQKSQQKTKERKGSHKKETKPVVEPEVHSYKPKYNGIEKSEKQRRIEEKRRLKKLQETEMKKRAEKESMAKLEALERRRAEEHEKMRHAQHEEITKSEPKIEVEAENKVETECKVDTEEKVEIEEKIEIEEKVEEKTEEKVEVEEKVEEKSSPKGREIDPSEIEVPMMEREKTSPVEEKDVKYSKGIKIELPRRDSNVTFVTPLPKLEKPKKMEQVKIDKAKRHNKESSSEEIISIPTPQHNNKPDKVVEEPEHVNLIDPPKPEINPIVSDNREELQIIDAPRIWPLDPERARQREASIRNLEQQAGGLFGVLDLDSLRQRRRARRPVKEPPKESQGIENPWELPPLPPSPVDWESAKAILGRPRRHARP